MNKKRRDNKMIMFGLIVAVLVILWVVGISHILASVIGLILSKEVSTFMGFYILVVISFVSSLFSRSD